VCYGQTTVLFFRCPQLRLGAATQYWVPYYKKNKSIVARGGLTAAACLIDSLATDASALFSMGFTASHDESALGPTALVSYETVRVELLQNQAGVPHFRREGIFTIE